MMDHKKATAVLGLTGVVITETAILKAWKRKMTLCHPDKNESPGANEASQLLNEAKECMLKSLEEGVFAEDAFSELNDVLADFKREMEEYNEEIKKNAIDCRERMKWFFRKDREKYLKMEGEALHKTLNKKPEPKKIVCTNGNPYRRVHTSLAKMEIGRKLIQNIKDTIKEDLEYSHDFVTFTFQLLDLYKKRYPDCGKYDLVTCKRNFGKYIKEVHTNLRHVCFRGHRGYIHLRIRGMTEMVFFPTLPFQYEHLKDSEARKRWKVPEALKMDRNRKNARKIKQSEKTPNEQDNLLRVDIQQGDSALPVA